MSFLRNTPIERKISVVIMLVTASALLLAGSILLFLELRQLNATLGRELASIAGIVGNTSKAALQFDDHRAAAQILSVLSEDKRILFAQLFDETDKPFAAYHPETGAVPAFDPVTSEVRPTPPVPEETISSVAVSEPVMLSGRRIGRVYLIAAFPDLRTRLSQDLMIIGGVVLAAALGAFILAARLRNLISLPILHLAETATRVSIENDYSIRAAKETEDETGMLVDRFNSMLEHIQRQNRALKESEDQLKALNEVLEQKVIERTSALRESQEQLRHSERLASIGILAAGLAHEIRNPLNSILLATQFGLKYKQSLDPTSREIFDSISKEAKRCASIIKNVLLFARAEKTEKSPHNLNDVIRHAVDVTRSYSESGKLVVNFQPDETLPPMRLNPTELEQVIVNLLVNAYEASGGSVTIDIRTQRVDGMIRCSVSDNGPGISHDMMKHIFDPFFSTKRQRGNTGLGLSLSHGIVTDHGGRMSVQSAVGVGTTFILEFPESKEGEELSVGNT